VLDELSASLEELGKVDELDGSADELELGTAELLLASPPLEEDGLLSVSTLLDDNASSLELETSTELLLCSPPLEEDKSLYISTLDDDTLPAKSISGNSLEQAKKSTTHKIADKTAN
jgi:hypothetical protein